MKRDLCKMFNWTREKDKISGGINSSFYLEEPKTPNQITLQDFDPFLSIIQLLKFLQKS